MKYALPISALLILSYSASVHAQLYKSVGPEGKITYSDTPPSRAARVETRAIGAGGPGASGLPYELAEAVKGNPVTLYTTGNCVPCDDGRKLLTERGIPFSEKTVNTDQDMAQFRNVGSDGQFPVLTIGRNKERGFENTAWNTALTAAGYPESGKLPKTYRNPPPEAAAPAQKPMLQADAKSKSKYADPASHRLSNDTELPPAVGNVPPGFRF